VKRKGLWLIVGVVVGLPFVLILGALVSYQIADRRSDTLVVAGETREYLLHVPESYDAARATPLVISMHGTGLWPAGHAAMSGWNAVAEEEGFIVVYPSATSISPVGWPKLWRAWEDLSGSDDTFADVRFISDLIDALDARYNIDRARIYANGYSSGGAMANLLACQLADRFAAIGTVATAHLSFDACGAFQPVPLIAFHGTADRQVPYEGGTSAMSADEPWDSVRRWTAEWAERNGCERTLSESAIAADVMRVEYSECESGAIVVLYTIEDGGHTWPGSDPPEWMSGMAGRTTDSIDATRVIWSFFRERTKR
jgi:polyhydroxybutyrate depolymerase